MMNITICGPAASGKGTIARLLAKRINIIYVDIGLIFRFGAHVLHTKLADSGEDLLSIIKTGEARYCWNGENPSIVLHGVDITSQLLSQEVAKITSMLASDSSMQTYLIAAANCTLDGLSDVVCDGRNAGISILSDAAHKFFLTASLEERARRRYADVQRQGSISTYQEVFSNIAERDDRDAKRSINPTAIPSGALVIETDVLGLEGSLDLMLSKIKHG